MPNLKGALESLSVPLSSILSTAFEQPMFGANYLTFEIRPSPEGGLVDGTKAEIRFKDQGIFEFVGALEKTRERAIYMKRQKAEEDEEDGLRMWFYFLSDTYYRAKRALCDSGLHVSHGHGGGDQPGWWKCSHRWATGLRCLILTAVSDPQTPELYLIALQDVVILSGHSHALWTCYELWL